MAHKFTRLFPKPDGVLLREVVRRPPGWQEATLAALAAYWHAHGYGPTQAELAAALGIHPSAVYKRLVKLERAGLAARVYGWRGWYVVEAMEEAA